jgi:riboflavin biosynthesis pyrimidine reductase
LSTQKHILRVVAAVLHGMDLVLEDKVDTAAADRAAGTMKTCQQELLTQGAVVAVADQQMNRHPDSRVVRDLCFFGINPSSHEFECLYP